MSRLDAAGSMLAMTERKEQHMDTSEHATQTHASATTKAIVAAHDGPVTAALDSVRWVRQGFLRRLKRDTVN
jgi:hypothetical protein